jgi:putative membrane protein
MRTTRLAYVISAVLVAQTTFSIAMAQGTQQPGRNATTGTGADRAHQPDSAARDLAMDKNLTGKVFADQAAIIGNAEIELGQLALEKSESDAVKKFAKKMVTDHSKSAAKLKDVAAKQNMQLPSSLDTEHRAIKRNLSALEGEKFDREYMDAMAKGHDKAVALFESATQSAQVPADLKQFAASTLPTLREHRQMAHSLEGTTDHHKDHSTAGDQ